MLRNKSHSTEKLRANRRSNLAVVVAKKLRQDEQVWSRKRGIIYLSKWRVKRNVYVITAGINQRSWRYGIGMEWKNRTHVKSMNTTYTCEESRRSIKCSVTTAVFARLYVAIKKYYFDFGCNRQGFLYPPLRLCKERIAENFEF